MDQSGYIKLFRKFLEWEWYDDNNCKVVFIHCLLKANFKEKQWRGKFIERGCFFTSIDNLATEVHLSNMQLRTVLSKLEKTGEINKTSTSDGTYITVCKYDDYQSVSQTDQQANNELITNDQQADNKQVTTTNNDKNDNKEKNIVYSSFYDIEIAKSNNDLTYVNFVKFLFGENENGRKLTKLLNMNDQIGFEQFKKLRAITESGGRKIKDVCLDLDNYTKKNYSSLNRTLNNWLKPKK